MVTLYNAIEMGCDITTVVIKSNEYLQAATLGMSMMASTKEEKSLLDTIEYAYQKSISPREANTKFVYLERRKTEAIHVTADDRFILILIGKITLKDKELMNARKTIKSMLRYDSEQFLIYYN
jgi:hypothetical protein